MSAVFRWMRLRFSGLPVADVVARYYRLETLRQSSHHHTWFAGSTILSGGRNIKQIGDTNTWVDRVVADVQSELRGGSKSEMGKKGEGEISAWPVEVGCRWRRGIKLLRGAGGGGWGAGVTDTHVTTATGRR